MEYFTDFLVSNYLWFLVTSIVLVFALIGYLVDQNEQKKGLSSINNKPKEKEVNLADLAVVAQNKSLNNAVSDVMKNSMPQLNSNVSSSQMPNYQNNVIQDVSNQMPSLNQNQLSNLNNNVSNSVSPVGFDVLTK